jgi:hypothetical protein
VITIVDNQSWLSLHVYLMSDFERVLILLKLEQVTDNLTKVILKAVGDNGGFTINKICARLCTLEQWRIGFARQEKQGYVPASQLSCSFHAKYSLCVSS